VLKVVHGPLVEALVDLRPQRPDALRDLRTCARCSHAGARSRVASSGPDCVGSRTRLARQLSLVRGTRRACCGHCWTSPDGTARVQRPRPQVHTLRKPAGLGQRAVGARGGQRTSGLEYVKYATLPSMSEGHTGGVGKGLGQGRGRRAGRAADLRAEVGEVGHDLEHVLEHVLALRADHALHDGEQDALQLRQQLRQAAHAARRGTRSLSETAGHASCSRCAAGRAPALRDRARAQVPRPARVPAPVKLGLRRHRPAVMRGVAHQACCVPCTHVYQQSGQIPSLQATLKGGKQGEGGSDETYTHLASGRRAHLSRTVYRARRQPYAASAPSPSLSSSSSSPAPPSCACRPPCRSALQRPSRSCTARTGGCTQLSLAGQTRACACQRAGGARARAQAGARRAGQGRPGPSAGHRAGRAGAGAAAGAGGAPGRTQARQKASVRCWQTPTA